MKTTDGVDLPPGCRDVEFLRAAHLTMPRGKLNEEAMERMAPVKPVESDTPVTLYTQRRGESVYSGTAAQSTNPFARNSQFTNDIRDGRIAHATAIDDISKVPHGIKPAATTAIGAELSIELALGRFKARLAERLGADSIRALRGVLDRYDTSGDGQVCGWLSGWARGPCALDVRRTTPGRCRSRVCVPWWSPVVSRGVFGSHARPARQCDAAGDRRARSLLRHG